MRKRVIINGKEFLISPRETYAPKEKVKESKKKYNRKKKVNEEETK